MNRHDFELIKSTSFGSISLHKNGDIILVYFNEGCLIDADVANEVIDEVYPIILKYKIELFISDNSAKYISSTPEARTYLSNNKSLSLLKAHAIIAKELPIRLMVNSFIKFNKPKVPFKSFNSYDKVIKWLYRFKDVNSSKVSSV